MIKKIANGKMSTFRYLVCLMLINILVWVSCKKEVTNPIQKLYLKETNIDSIGGSDYSFYEIIALPDNSFWLRYTIKSFPPFKEKFEHYDENYKLINTLILDRYRFGKFIINGNNDIVTSAMYINPDNKGVYHFLKLDNNFNFIEKNNATEIMSNLSPLVNKSYINYFTKLSSGKYILGFFTTYGFSGYDSADIILASYTNPPQTGVPNWVNRNKYYDNSLGIKQSSVLDIGADNNNNFYVLCQSNPLVSNQILILRKHNENGDLIWQKKNHRSRISK